MSEKNTVKDNQDENGMDERPTTVHIVPKAICNAMPAIKQMKTESDGIVNRITYGRDYEEICKHCGKKFSDHDTLRYA